MTQSIIIICNFLASCFAFCKVITLQISMKAEGWFSQHFLRCNFPYPGWFYQFRKGRFKVWLKSEILWNSLCCKFWGFKFCTRFFFWVCHCDSRHHEALCLNMNVLLHQMAHSQMEASPSSFVWLMKSQDCSRNCSTNSSQSFSITLRDSVNATEVLLPIKAKLSSPSLLSLFVNNMNKMRTKRLQMRYLAEEQLPLF